jgi:UDP-N-acetylmuramoylalanine--D-glutamate ligase
MNGYHNIIPGKKAVVLGMGLSGIAVAKLLHRYQFDVFVSDIKEPSQLSDQLWELQYHHIYCETGGHSEDRLLKADFIVISPGIPERIEVVQKALKKGIPLYSEIEVASWFCRAPIIGITGTNGKTTTATLTGNLIKTTFPGSFIGGNIGIPFADKADQLSKDDFAVLELSSFQLERIRLFRADIAVLLNLSPDHLDRYARYEDYIAAKARILGNQTEDDVIIYNADDPQVIELASSAKSKKFPFSFTRKPETGLYFDGENFSHLDEHGEHHVTSVKNIKLKGWHNYQNVCAAASAAITAGVPLDLIKKELSTFNGIEHRIEYLGQVHGIHFYNDSKATNTDALYWALRSFDKPLILLAGGLAKENDFSRVEPLINEKVKMLYLFGASRDKIDAGLNLDKKIKVCKINDLQEAFRQATRSAQSGDIILLSPMCASLDQYKNFEERGAHFKQLVKEFGG